MKPSATLDFCIFPRACSSPITLPRLVSILTYKARHTPRPPLPLSPNGQLPTAAATIPPDVVCTFSCGAENEENASTSASSSTSLSKLPALPTGARIADQFLTTLVRLCRLEELPLTVLARVGYRTTGAAADVDGTDEVIGGVEWM